MTGAMFNVQFQVPWGGGRKGSRSKISACHSSNSILVDLVPESLDLVESRIGLTKSIYHYIILVNPILCLLLCPASCWNIARVKVLGSLSFFVVVLFWSWSRKLYRMLSKTKNGQNWAILGLLSWTVQKKPIGWEWGNTFSLKGLQVQKWHSLARGGFRVWERKHAITCIALRRFTWVENSEKQGTKSGTLWPQVINCPSIFCVS